MANIGVEWIGSWKLMSVLWLWRHEIGRFMLVCSLFLFFLYVLDDLTATADLVIFKNVIFWK